MPLALYSAVPEYSLNGLYIVNGHTHCDHVHSEGGALTGRQRYVCVSPKMQRCGPRLDDQSRIAHMHDKVARAPEGNEERAVGHADHIGFAERHEALVVNAATAIGLIVAA